MCIYNHNIRIIINSIYNTYVYIFPIWCHDLTRLLHMSNEATPERLSMLPLVTSQLIGVTDSWVGIAPVLKGVAAKIDSDSFMEKQSRAWDAKDFPESWRVCCRLELRNTALVFAKKVCYWRWTKYGTYKNIIVFKEAEANPLCH